MQRLVRFLAWLFLLLVFSASIAFSFFNTTAVALSFGFFELPEQPVALWVIGAFVLGGLCGLMLGSGFMRNIKARYQFNRLQKKLTLSEKEVARLKALTLKDLQ